MSGRRRKSARKGKGGPGPDRGNRPARSQAVGPQPVIPDAPPMADRRGNRWPLWITLAIYALWLAFLAFLAMYSDRWQPGQ